MSESGHATVPPPTPADVEQAFRNLRTAFRTESTVDAIREALRGFAKVSNEHREADLAAGVDQAEAFGGTYPGTGAARPYSDRFMVRALVYVIATYGVDKIDPTRISHDIMGCDTSWMGEFTRPVLQIGEPRTIEDWRKARIVDGADGHKPLVRPDRPSQRYKISMAPSRLKKTFWYKGEKYGYDGNGCPVLPALADVLLPMEKIYCGRPEHFAFCDLQIKSYLESGEDPYSMGEQMGLDKMQVDSFLSGEYPTGLVWHHHQDTGRMQLVPEEVHDTLRHTGGMAAWGQDAYRIKTRHKPNGSHASCRLYRRGSKPRGTR